MRAIVLAFLIGCTKDEPPPPPAPPPAPPVPIADARPITEDEVKALADGLASDPGPGTPSGNMGLRRPDGLVPGPGHVAIVGTQAIVGDASLPPADVVRRITDVYLAGLHHCYRDALDLDPAVHGRLATRFEVDTGGHTLSTEALGLTPKLEACVKAAMARWTFTSPRRISHFAVTYQLDPK